LKSVITHSTLPQPLPQNRIRESKEYLPKLSPQLPQNDPHLFRTF
jgi:hypothetical protein